MTGFFRCCNTRLTASFKSTNAMSQKGMIAFSMFGDVLDVGFLWMLEILLVMRYYY